MKDEGNIYELNYDGKMRKLHTNLNNFIKSCYHLNPKGTSGMPINNQFFYHEPPWYNQAFVIFDRRKGFDISREIDDIYQRFEKQPQSPLPQNISAAFDNGWKLWRTDNWSYVQHSDPILLNSFKNYFNKAQAVEIKNATLAKKEIINIIEGLSKLVA